MGWKWQFAQNGEDDVKADFFIKGTRKCKIDEVPGKPAMPVWIKEVQSIIKKHVKEESERIKQTSSTIRYESIARTCLKENKIALISEDKRPGFCMIPVEKLKIAHEKILVKPNYEEVAQANSTVFGVH